MTRSWRGEYTAIPASVLVPIVGRRPRSLATAGLCIALATLAAGIPATRADVTPDEARLLSHLDASRALSNLRHLSNDVVRTRSGLGDGTAVSGSIEEKALARDVTRQMRALGLEVRLEPFPVRAYRYGPVTLVANGAPVEAISLHAAGGTWGSRDAVQYARGNAAGGRRIDAPLVDAGEGYAPDYDRLGDVRGRVVLVHRELRDWPPAQITEAAYRGAVAIVFYDHPTSDDQLDALRQDSMWAHEQIPAVAISRRSAESLRHGLAAGSVSITLENRVDVSDGESQNVVGILRGSELPDEWVVVAAHYDRWFHGAGDNTSGVATVLEAAHAFTAGGVRPRRSVIFMATGSEEAGVEDAERDWLAGSHAFLQRHPQVLRNAALIFNLDLVGWTSPAGVLMSTPDVAAHQAALLADLGYASRMTVVVPTTDAIDAWNYGIVGGAAMNHLWRATSTGTPAYFPIYHTQQDVFRREYYDNMPMDLRLVTLSLWRAANEPRLAISLTALADFVATLLSGDAAKAPNNGYAEAQAALAAFRSAAAVVEAAGGDVPPDQVNRILMATRHRLVPWLYASNGDFEQVARTGEDSARVAVLGSTIAALRAGDRDGARAALGGLYEGRQCLRLSATSYAEERGFWIGDGGWATRFGHRTPPPPPAFDAGCARLAAPGGDLAPAIAAFGVARDDAAEAVAQSLATISVKLREATKALAEFAAQRHLDGSTRATQ